MSTQLEEIQRRTHRYFYEDGLVEMAVGLLFMVVGLALLLTGVTEPGSPLAGLVWIALAALVIGGAFTMQRLVARLKQRITYPRTGVVIYNTQPTRGRWLVVLAALALAVGQIFLPEWASRMALAEGLLLAIILFYLGYRVSLTRLYLPALIAAGLGVAASLMVGSDIAGSAVVFGGAGAALLISGLAGLRRYLHHNPLPEQDPA